MAISPDPRLIPGVCGVVPGSIDPGQTGIEAGLSAVGDMFDAIAQRAGSTVAALSQGFDSYRAGQSGLMRMTWDNGDRTVLVNPQLGGVTLGWTLANTAKDELAAAIEGTAFHTRIIFDRLEEYGTPIQRVIQGGGIPQKSEFLNRVYASVLNKPMLVPASDVTSVGAAVFAFLAAGTYGSLAEAQAAMAPQYRVIEPDAGSVAVYQELYEVYRELYFTLGNPESGPLGKALPTLRRVAGKG
jgi:L-ribulokinase